MVLDPAETFRQSFLTLRVSLDSLLEPNDVFRDLINTLFRRKGIFLHVTIDVNAVPLRQKSQPTVDADLILIFAPAHLVRDSPKRGLGRGGRINTANGHVIINTDKGDVFVNRDISTVECGELMSKGGALFSGYNELNGQTESIICYYTKRQ